MAKVTLEAIRKGSTGDLVITLQECLTQLGYDIGTTGIDGDFGEATEAAVIQFQSDNGLEIDGIVGPQTWDVLSAQCSNMPLPSNGSRAPSLTASDRISLEELSRITLTMADIYNKYGKYLKEKSQELGISTASAAAVLKVESQGSGFGSNGRMIIRFENHVFYDGWGKNYKTEFNDHFRFNTDRRWEGHRFRKSTDEEFADFHGNQNKEWEVFEFARGMDESAAIKSISMGAAQIMGFNFSMLGYDSPQEMLYDMSNSIQAQLDGMFKFISRRNECITGLQMNDYIRFAKCYNGKGKAQRYGSLIEEAAGVYSNVSAGKIFD